jgi:hypothetical protein
VDLYLDVESSDDEIEDREKEIPSIDASTKGIQAYLNLENFHT